MAGDEDVQKLCTNSVVRGGCIALGASTLGAEPWASPAQLAETLAASDEEVDALLRALFQEGELSGNRFVGVRALCGRLVLRIPSILGKAAPRAPWSGCVDDGCGMDGVDVSREALVSSGLVSPLVGGLDTDTAPPGEIGPVVPDTPDDRGRDLFRRALNVLFGIFPAVDEKDDDDAPATALVEQATNSGAPDVAFGPGTFPGRHQYYRQYVLKASAWIAMALRRMADSRRFVKKWFNLNSNDQIDEQLRRTRRHLARMLASTSRLEIRRGTDQICRVSFSATVTRGNMGYVMKRALCGVDSTLDCGQKSDGRYVINICEFFWHYIVPEEARVGTMVHEPSHHFGTEDVGYCQVTDCLRLSPSDARQNADSYTYFVKNVVQTPGLGVEHISDDYTPHGACNTMCNPTSFEGGRTFGQMLPRGTCGECRAGLHVSLGGFRLWGNGCGEGFVNVSKGMVKQVCCKPHKCSLKFRWPWDW